MRMLPVLVATILAVGTMVGRGDDRNNDADAATTKNADAEKGDAKKKDAKKDDAPSASRPVKIRDLTLQIPPTWETAPNANNMRLVTYRTPTAEGDAEKGEFTVFNFPGGGGDLSDNLSRWIKQFKADGRTVKVVKGMAADNEYFVADIAGTYNKPVGPPILGKSQASPGYRMLNVILVLKGKGVYYLKLTGPDETIKAQATALRKSFGGDVKTEQEYEI